LAFIIPKKQGQAAVGTGAGTLVYTVGASLLGIVKCIDICNTTAAAINVNVHLVPLAGSATTANALMYVVSVPANGVYQWTGTQILEAGGFIQAVGASAGLTINVSGGEYSTTY
jgi:hypothetical protein